MRPSGLTSIWPNFEKSTSGIFGKPAPDAAADVKVCLTHALTSSAVMRPLYPVPLMRRRSAPSSRANLRTDGLACTVLNETLTSTCVVAAGALGVVAGGRSGAAGVGAAGVGARSAAAGGALGVAAGWAGAA